MNSLPVSSVFSVVEAFVAFFARDARLRSRRAASGRFIGFEPFELFALALNLFVSQKFVPLMATERADVFDELRVMIEAGSIKPPVDRTFPLSEAVNAIDYVYTRRSAGKVVVTI